MDPLKSLHQNAISRALEKAKHYRLLNDPENSESICLDILDVDKDNQEALVVLILAITDQFRGGSKRLKEVNQFVSQLKNEFENLYYSGIVFEKSARATLEKGKPGAKYTAFEWFQQSMEFYDKAESLSDDQNDDAILRWNACARTIQKHNLMARPEENYIPYGD